MYYILTVRPAVCAIPHFSHPLVSPAHHGPGLPGVVALDDRLVVEALDPGVLRRDDGRTPDGWQEKSHHVNFTYDGASRIVIKYTELVD